ncbi:hypothetical protein [Gracilibacillus lacisalsi]|uniref:hypothetical protein n=1 Tax=Gracilibacillus lacisalsi TaxID=393087 RepID=UPI0003814872|nr:hypothetical protein [Gracilibacillus lacisalsi]
MNLSSNSTILLHDLIIKEENKFFLVENSYTGEFYQMPKPAIEAIKKINRNENLNDIEIYLEKKYPEEDIDIIEFIKQLLDLGLVKAIDNEEIAFNSIGSSPTGFKWISPSFAKKIFNRWTILLFIIILTINVWLFISFPRTIPNFMDIFIFESMIANMLIYLLLSLILLIFHEFGHILAIRSFDLPASVNVGHRLFFVVAETDLTAGWKLPSKKRNILFLGGMFIDQLILFTVLLIKLTVSIDHHLMNGILSVVVLDIFIRTIYQCCFYMKTDLYYLVENITGCYNLMENGKNYMAKWIPFIKVDETSTTFEGEEKVVKLYGVFSFIGVILTMSLFIIYFIPQTIYLMVNTLPHLMNPIDNPYFWDALVIVAQFILMISLLIYSIRKKRKSAST